MARSYERAILEPNHAAFGYPRLAFVIMCVGAMLWLWVHVLVVFAFVVCGHAMNIYMRRKAPHGEEMFIRRLRVRKSLNDWSRRRRIYFG